MCGVPRDAQGNGASRHTVTAVADNHVCLRRQCLNRASVPVPSVNFLFLSQHRRPMSQADPAHTSGLPVDAVERCTKV